MRLRNVLLLLFFPAIFSFCSNGEVKIEFNHPLQANETAIGEWKWMDVDGMICRDSSTTGIGVRLGSNSKKWMIYLQGGGACFTPETCATNPANYSGSNFLNSINSGQYKQGIMNNAKEENPVKDWNVVYVPYCTGDVHSGNFVNGLPLGGTEPQQFVGNRNIKLLLEYLKPYMDENEVDEIMIAGISAGGFGTHITYFETKKLFPNIKTHVINDSGPLVSDPQILTFCMGIGIQFMYNLAVPPGFLGCCQPSYGLADIYTLAARLDENDNFGLISYTADNTIRYFFAAGQNTCTGGEISAEDFENGLIHLRENVLKPSGKWSTYFVNGTDHTFIYSDTDFYNTRAEDKYLYEWIQDVMDGEVQHIYE